MQRIAANAWIRYARVGPDGYLYVLTDASDGGTAESAPGAVIDAGRAVR